MTYVHDGIRDNIIKVFAIANFSSVTEMKNFLPRKSYGREIYFNLTTSIAGQLKLHFYNQSTASTLSIIRSNENL